MKTSRYGKDAMCQFVLSGSCPTSTFSQESFEVVGQSLHQALHADGGNEKAENFGKDRANGFSEYAIDRIDKITAEGTVQTL